MEVVLCMGTGIIKTSLKQECALTLFEESREIVPYLSRVFGQTDPSNQCHRSGPEVIKLFRAQLN